MGAAASAIPVELFTSAKIEYERLKSESPDISDEALFEAMKNYIVGIEGAAVITAPVEGVAPIAGEVAPPAADE